MNHKSERFKSMRDSLTWEIIFEIGRDDLKSTSKIYVECNENLMFIRWHNFAIAGKRRNIDSICAKSIQLS